MKNLTQLPWSGKGSKAKNDNTLGLMHVGLRSMIGSMSLKNTSLFGVILALLLTLGVGEMWGVDYYLRGVNGNWDASAANKMTAGTNNIVWMSHATNSGYIGFLITAGTSYDTKYGQNSGNAVFGSPYLMKQGGGNAYTDNWSAGTYYYYFNTSTKYLTVYNTIEIKGDLMSTGWSNVTSMTFQSGGSWKQNCTATLTAGDSYNFKIHANGTWTGYSSNVSCTNGTAAAENGNNGDNIMVVPTHGGTAVVVFHPEAGGTIEVHCPYQVSYAVGTGASGTVSASAVTTYGSTCTLSSSTFIKAGYTQDGWATSDGGDKVYNLGATYTGGYTDVTLYPHWVENTYEVKVATITPSAGGSASPTSWTYMGQISGGDITATPNTGYSFSGWSILSGGGGYFGTSGTATTSSIAETKFRPTKSSSLKATFTANSYTFTLNGNGGSDGSVTIKYDSDEPTTISGASRAGYSLNGYYTAASGGNKVINANGSLNNVSGWVSGGYWKQTDETQVLYAQWTESAEYYTLNFSHGTSSTGHVSVAAKNTDTEAAISNGSSLVSGTGVTLTATPETHYRFVGWYSNAACTSLVSSSNPYSFGITAHTSLYAKVELMTTVITLDKNGGSGSTPATLTATHGSSSLSSGYVVPTRTGYTLQGWYTAESGGSRILLKGGTTTSSVSGYLDGSGNWIYTESTLTLYAHWAESMSALTTSNHFDVGSPSYAIPTKSVSSIGISTTATLTATTPSAGYTFAGWTLSSNLVVTSGDKDTDLSITVRTNGNGAAASAQANYAEDLSTPYVLNGGSAFGVDTWAQELAFTKKSGESTGSVAYLEVPITTAMTDGTKANYEFKIVTGSTWCGLDAAGGVWEYYSNSGEQTLGVGSGDNIRLNAAAQGTYVFKLDYTTPESPKITVTWPLIVYLDEGDEQSYMVNTNQIFLTGHITSGGGDGDNATDMVAVGFDIGGTKYPMTCKNSDNGYFWGYVTGLTPGTTYTVKAYATNSSSTSISENSKAITTRAAGTTTIKIRTAHGRTAPKIYAFADDGSCNGAGAHNEDWPGESMGDAIITGTTYDWYEYELSNEYNMFLVSENGDPTKTDDFGNPFEDKCYWYHATDATQGNRMGEMSCPYLTPQLMIDDGTDANYEYNEMSVDGSVLSKTISLNTKTGYRFKIVYNSEWYGKAGTNVTRANNTLTEISPGVEDNLYITTDVTGDYNFSYNTSTGLLTVTYPTAYTVTFGMGTGGATISASATSAGGTLTSGDYVAAGDDVTFTQTATSTGYTFAGWYDASTGGSAVSGMGTSDNVLDDIAANATVYAQYTPNNYTVTFDATTNGGTCGTPSKSVTFDAAYGDLPEATKDAKVFAGWYTTASGAGTQVTAETIVSTADDHTLYARFEDTYSVTIQYKSGDVTLKPNGSTTASATALAPEITAPEFLGYTFTGWTGTSATFADASSATTTVNVTAATTITANYSAIPTVYFKNNLGWDHVYVTFDNEWSSDAPTNNGKPYFEMTQMGESDIFYCAIPSTYTASNYASWAWNIAFDNHGFEASENVGSHSGGFNTGEFVGRGDFDPKATMFIPYYNDTEARNGGTYYKTGCWMMYNSTESGYQVKVNKWVTGANADTLTVNLTADIAGGYEFSAIVNLKSANYGYGFKLYKDYQKITTDIYYSNKGSIHSNTTTLPWEFATKIDEEEVTADTRRCELYTESLGDYKITVSFATGKPMVDVEYPVSIGDWKLIYKDRATWSNGAHSASWCHPSRVIKAKANAEDIVSFYVAYGSTPSVELHKCTAINALTGAETWVKQSDVSLSEITSTGIYNFKVSQDAEKAATVTVDGGYDGNFYIRTDASDGGWANYKTSGTNTMTYSEYAEEKSGFTHYFMRYVNTGTNIKFCIANDYSECISDTLVGDSYTGEYIAVYGNVRFMWDHRTNKVSRAYISGSSNVSDRFLVLEGDNKMFNESGTALTTAAGGKVEDLNEYEMNFTDDQNWIYEATVKAQPGARIKLTAKYNNKIQYFYGAEGDRGEETTELLLGGNEESENKYKIRVVYDFKTNRLIKAFIPEGNISEELTIEADLMIIREAQGEAQQINFIGSGKLADVKTVYGAMKFNKWTVNGKEKTGGHATTSESRYKRDLFYISFPFDVKLSDVFGFGTYGTHWIIEYYDGKGRAKNGFWADSDSYWKFVLPSQRSSFTLKAFEGYILALDLDEMTESSSIWNNDVEDVYVYFPSSAAVEDIQATNRLITIDQEGYQCQIGPRFDGGDDRRVKDSYWHVIGVPSFANYNNPLTETNGGTAIDWRDDDGDWETPNLPYLYEWNSANNSLTVTTSATFNFKATYSYMVQYAGTSIYWSAVNATPSSVVARKNDNHPTSAEFRLELLQGEEKADQTFVRLTDEENVTTGFDFNYDLSKEMNSNRANIFTMITTTMSDGNTVTESAANCLPMNNQTTVVPVGVKIAANGDYTFAIPEGTEGVGVTLIDQETGIRTSLSAVDYTVSLEPGTYNERFVLEISPIQHIATEIEPSAVSDQQSDVRKLLIDGLLYIVRDGKVYDARGARIE